jgi:hypothetical protein
MPLRWRRNATDLQQRHRNPADLPADDLPDRPPVDSANRGPRGSAGRNNDLRSSAGARIHTPTSMSGAPSAGDTGLLPTHRGHAPGVLIPHLRHAPAAPIRDGVFWPRIPASWPGDEWCAWVTSWFRFSGRASEGFPARVRLTRKQGPPGRRGARSPAGVRRHDVSRAASFVDTG